MGLRGVRARGYVVYRYGGMWYGYGGMWYRDMCMGMGMGVYGCVTYVGNVSLTRT